MNPLIQSRLIRHMADRKTSQNIIKRGFTLVELMVVIVIVGILSGVALPQFLSQSEKAKATEAKTNFSAIFKNTASEYQAGELDATATTCEGAPANNDTKFNYVCSFDSSGTEPRLLVTATGNTKANNGDASIAGKTLTGCINLETGLTRMNQTLGETALTTAACS